jgi:hypothetical protein
VTSKTEDEGRLVELLLDNTMSGGEVVPLAAVEPILIAARMTRQPADWAFTARIWTEGVLPTSLSGDPAAALREHGSATLDEHYGHSHQPLPMPGLRCQHHVGRSSADAP